MDQLFHACAYDKKSRECYIIAAGEFAANCYSDSPAVCSIHYLLRQKQYNIIWNGGDKASSDYLGFYDRTEELHNWDTIHCVDYSGYLVNHTKKRIIDLADYYKKSLSCTHEETRIIIDPIPVLTETGGGTLSALDQGFSTSITEKLAAAWCGDLLEIIDRVPESYELIDCCFAEAWARRLMNV